jgi:WD40 repeat protein/serine/threonine protein kinase
MTAVNERELFMAALQMEDPAQRAGYVAEACGGDVALRQRIEALLKAFGAAGSFLQKPAADEGATSDQPAIAAPPPIAPLEGVGTVIGPYKLLQQIGEGGMGTVFMAEQTHPVQRKVALKIIKPGMDSRQVIARFEAERQALALMDHPNIAKVLDAGTTGDRGQGLGGREDKSRTLGLTPNPYSLTPAAGRPYFVMELVKGVPITRYCDEHRLTPKQRLELFVPVCQAVQHAHQKGIIHRDLKPSNVLVAEYDDRPVPKVIDFGVAKATGPKLTDRTMFTEFGQVVGTLEYMSPEQAKLNALDIDTRSDIYALGVLLYELLTGTTPFEKKRLHQAAFDEMLRVIREEEPPRPSRRLSTTKELPSIAANRGLEPRKLSGLVRGELDWIVMKCLEKDRNRRYETANGLAHDIERYLGNEPVQACSPSARYRLRKFVRRHRGPVLTACVLVFALLTAAIGTTTGWLRATWERDRKQEALDAEQEAKNLADKRATELERNLYFQHIALVAQKLEANDLARVEELLNECPPKLRHWEWHYLMRWYRFGPYTELPFYSTPAKYWSAAFSSDGKQLAASLANGSVCTWDVSTRQPIRTLFGHFGTVGSVAMSHDRQWIAAAGGDGSIKLWDRATGDLVRTLSCKSPEAYEICFSADSRKLASVYADGMVRLWDPQTGVELRSIAAHKDSAFGLAFDPKGVRLASASFDNTVKIWDAATGSERRTFRGHEAGPLCVAFSPDGKRVASGGWDMTIQIWDPETGVVERTLRGHNLQVRGVAFSPDGKRLASVGGDLRLWDVETGQELLALRGATGFMKCVRFSPDGQLLATPSWDQTLKIWDGSPVPEKAKHGLMTLRGFAGPVYRVAISNDGTRIAGTSTDHTARVWEADSGQLVHRLEGHRDVVEGVAFSPNGCLIATASRDKTIRIWDSATAALVKTLDASEWMNCVEFSPDGSLLAAAGRDWGAKVGIQTWNTTTWEKNSTQFAGSHAELHRIAFSPDSRTVAAGARTSSVGAANSIRLWDAATGRVLQTLSSSPGSLAFHPDGKRVAAWGDDRTLKMWDVKTGAEVSSVQHEVAGSNLVIHPDGRRLFLADMSGSVAMTDLATGRVLRKYRGHAQRISALACSRDGRMLVSGSFDQTVRVWDATLTTEEWYGPEARELVQAQFAKHSFRETVVANLKSDKSLTDEVRASALRWAEKWQEDPHTLDDASWEIARNPGRKAEEYELAWRRSETACRLAPGNGEYLLGLGAAQYRTGRYEQAVKSLLEGEKLTAERAGGVAPGTYANQAMALFQLGKKAEARATLDRAREVIKVPHWANNEEALSALKEAEALIDKK